MNDFTISLELSEADMETLLSALRSIALDAEYEDDECEDEECEDDNDEKLNNLCFDWDLDAAAVVMRNKYTGEGMPISAYVHMLLEVGSSVL